ncbi:Ig-like V-type domain-containing protein FAM187A [Eucyclogobius newberryi]|uniref:Ig-like V-type domain-containing protein FAM187A n=1 Tax=Eucyclogobius newberryi TaxID=166745 RepID=UPI003B5BAD2F
MWSYEVSYEFKHDVFAHTACPAFLTFKNKAYVEGTTVVLPCPCKPMEVQQVIWYHRDHATNPKEAEALTDDDELTSVDPDAIPHAAGLRSRFTIRMFSLVVFSSRPEDSGIYICGSKKDFFYAYDLDIQEARKITLTVSPRSKDTPISDLYETFTIFENWTMCDRCERPGEKVRVGLCYVKSDNLPPRYQGPNLTVNSCGSGGVIKVFGHISHKGAELEVTNCEESCQAKSTSRKRDSQIHVHGSSSSSQDVQVKVYHLNHPAKTILTIGCPGAKANMAVAWDKGTTPMFKRDHIEPVEGPIPRISIDTGHHLVFNLAQQEDSGEYYCWLQGRLVAQIHLLVYAHMGRNHPVITNPELFPALNLILVSYIGMTAVFLLILVIKAVVLTIRGEEPDQTNLSE